MVKEEEAELAILETYLPKMMNKTEIEKVARAKKKELSITDATKKGMLMSAVMKDLKGKADGTLVRLGSGAGKGKGRRRQVSEGERADRARGEGRAVSARRKATHVLGVYPTRGDSASCLLSRVSRSLSSADIVPPRLRRRLLPWAEDRDKGLSKGPPVSGPAPPAFPMRELHWGAV